MYFTAKPHYFIGNLAMVGGVLTFYLKSVIRFNDQCGELADKQLSSDFKKNSNSIQFLTLVFVPYK